MNYSIKNAGREWELRDTSEKVWIIPERGWYFSLARRAAKTLPACFYRHIHICVFTHALWGGAVLMPLETLKLKIANDDFTIGTFKLRPWCLDLGFRTYAQWHGFFLCIQIRSFGLILGFLPCTILYGFDQVPVLRSILAWNWSEHVFLFILSILIVSHAYLNFPYFNYTPPPQNTHKFTSLNHNGFSTHFFLIWISNGNFYGDSRIRSIS